MIAIHDCLLEMNGDGKICGYFGNTQGKYRSQMFPKVLSAWC